MNKLGRHTAFSQALPQRETQGQDTVSPRTSQVAGGQGKTVRCETGQAGDNLSLCPLRQAEGKNALNTGAGIYGKALCASAR